MTVSVLKLAQSESAVENYVTFSQHVTENVVSTKGGDFISVIKIDGRSHLSASLSDVYAWADSLNKLLSGIASPHVGLWSHVIRRAVTEYPESQFETQFSRGLDKKYRETFGGYSLMLNELYLTIVYRPVADGISSFFAAFERQSAKVKAERQAECIKALEEINRTVIAGLKKSYGAELLGLEERNGYMYSQVGEFLSYLVNLERIPVPLTKRRICEVISVNRPHFSSTSYLGQISSPAKKTFLGMLDIFDYPSSTEPGHLNMLLQTDYEFILTQSLAILSRAGSLGALDRQQKALEDAKDHSETQIRELNKAKDMIQSGEVFGGTHHATFTILGTDLRQVELNVSNARALFAEYGIIAKPVDSALEAGFWAQLPGNYSYRPRPSFITSQNFISFSSFHNFLSGKPTGNPWGEATTVFKTLSQSPLYFSYHYSRDDIDATDKKFLGNTMITGMAGTGKTVLLTFLQSQAEKHKATAVYFDKDRGMEVAIRMMGGRYQALKNGYPTGFNPFQLDPTPANMAFLRQFVKELASESGPVTHEDELAIEHALGVVMFDMPRPLRRMTVLLQSLINATQANSGRGPTVHARLLKWTEGHSLGWVFDNPDDLIDLSTHRLYGFDVTDFLDNPETRGPLMMYLIYRTEAMIDGRRFIYGFDEFWKPLQDSHFQNLVKNKLKTIRKQNGLCLFSTQEVEDACMSPISSTLISQVATHIYLPNPRASRDIYINRLNMTPAEFELFMSLGEDSRCFMIKQGGSAAIAKLDLFGFDDELLVLSGTPELAELSEELANTYGEHPDNWSAEFYRRARDLTKGIK